MVAHSYGGIVTAEAAAGVEAVRHLVLVSSYLPEAGQSLSSFGGEEPAPFLDIDPEGGTFTVRPEALAGTFLQDCGPEIQRQAVGRTARQSLAVLGSRCGRRPGSRCPRPTSCARRTGAPRRSGSASSPVAQPPSWSSTPGTTRSCPGPPRSAI